MFSYFAYGLGIHSTIALPELVTKDVPADITIREGNVETPADAVPLSEWTSLTPDGALIRHESARFLIQNRNDITLDPGNETDMSILRRYLLGQVLGMVLHLRGLLILHASAVSISSQGVIFLGNAGWGKSTTAAILAQRGHTLVADDITAVKLQADSATLFPGYPQLKLSSETATSLQDESANLVPIPGTKKFARRRADGFDLNPVPLKRIYVLSDDEEMQIQKLNARDAFMELLRNSYFACFLPDLNMAVHHSQCAALVNMVNVRSLKRPRDLGRLPQVAAMIEEDIHHE
jgi:hypothetical protein